MGTKANIDDISIVYTDSITNPRRQTRISATLLYSGNDSDRPIPGVDTYTFTFSSTKYGNISPAPGSDYTVSITQDPKDPNKYTACMMVVAKAYGGCSVTGSKTGDPNTWPSTAVTFTVEPVTAIPYITKQPAPALLVSPVPGKPDDSPTLVTQIDVTVFDSDKNTVTEYPVSFTIKNVRTQTASQTGVFYNGNKAPIALNLTPNRNNSNDSTVTLPTDTNGVATLYIGSNSNAGYVQITITAGGYSLDGCFVYIYEKMAGYEFDPPKTNIARLLPNYDKTTFPVTVENNNITNEEFIGLFLNDKFQNQAEFDNINQDTNYIKVDANIDDLIVNDNPHVKTNNYLYYFRTHTGDIIKSLTSIIPIFGPLPDPQPENQILGPMADPYGGVINIGSIVKNGVDHDYITSINLAIDTEILLKDLNYTLKAGDIVTLHATFQGDYKADDNFASNKYNYKATVITPTDTEFHITIPFGDTSGYGTPKNSQYKNLYKMYYSVTPKGTNKEIAASSFSTGTLSTRII